MWRYSLLGACAQIQRYLLCFVGMILLFSDFLLPGNLSAQESPVGHTTSPSSASHRGGLSEVSSFFFREAIFEGNTVISSAELAAVSSSYINRIVSFEEIQQLRHDLSQYYIRKGYISSGVVVPDQEVSAGVILFRVIEGSLSHIEIEGNRYYSRKYYTERLAPTLGAPLNVFHLQDSLQRMQQDSRIKQIQASLSPGTLPGQSNLNVRIEEQKPFRIEIRTGNIQSPSVGSYVGELSITHQSLLGLSDVFTAGAGLSEGARSYHVGYSLPINRFDTVAGIYFRKNDAIVVENLFRNLDIEDRSDTFGLTVRQPLYRTADTEITISASGELRKSSAFLLQQPFSFSEGQEEGRSKVAVIRLGQELVRRTSSSVIAFRSVISIGQDAFGATVHEHEPDGRFISWLGQFQLIQQLNESGLQLRLRSDAQIASDALLSIEKFSLGGINSVRGYRTNQLVRDSGITASAELRIPLTFNAAHEPVFQIIPFIDGGYAWNARGTTPSPKTIGGTGVGFKWAVSQIINVEIYGALPFVKIRNTEKDLQDSGIHFLMTWQIL